jgi:DNA-binding NarL/FixJ family response regulator
MKPNREIRVAVVEDRQEERDRIVRLLNVSAGFTCVGACSTGEEALQSLPTWAPDVVLMDIQMPGMSGIDCTRELKASCPATQIMMLTVVEDHERLFKALAAGATGYMLKKTPSATLLEAIQELHAGGAPMSGQIARQVVTALHQPAVGADSGEHGLSPIEHKVLQWLARGLLYKEVAQKLNLSPSTVRTHVWHIYRKLQVHNRTEAVLKGLGAGGHHRPPVPLSTLSD